MQDSFIPNSGFVTAIDDPEGLGRVKVHCEAIDGTNPAQETTWVNILKGPEGFGSDGPSPPQVGTRVIVQVNKTNPSIRQVVSVVGSQKQKANPAMPGNISLEFLRAAYEAKRNPTISGPGKVDQEKVPNGRGSDKSKLDVRHVEQQEELSVKQRREIPTQMGANPQTVTVPPPVKNVNTALSIDASIFTTAMAALLPGQIFKLSKIFDDFLKGDLLNELKSKIPTEVMTAFQNIAETSAEFTPANGDGFMQNITRVNPAVFGANMLEALKDVKNTKELKEALNKIVTDDSITGLSAMADVAMTGLSGFGSIPQLLKANGDVENVASDLIDKAKELFSGLLSGIPILGGSGNFLPSSQITSDMVERMIPEKAAAFKKMFEDLSGSAPRVAIEGKLAELQSLLKG